MVSKGWGGGKLGLITNRQEVSLGSDGNVLESNAGDNAQYGEHTKNHGSVHLKTADFMLCGLYRNIKITLKQASKRTARKTL